RGDRVKRRSPSSLPGLTRQSILLRKQMDARVKPAHDGLKILGRREFMSLLGAGAAAAWPRAARAQRTGTIARLGYLSTANPRSAPFFRAFEQRLRDLGYIDGENIIIEYRNVEGDVGKLPELAADLVRLDVNVIVTATAPATRAAMSATTTIPILMVAIN